MILQSLERKRRQCVLRCGAAVYIWDKEVPVVQTDFEDFVLLHKRDAEQVLQALEQEGLV